MDRSSVVSILENQPVIEAFKLMALNRVTSVAVLTKDGKLVGNVSAHDIRVCETHVFFC
jgi:CBS domain-containing protein